MAQKRKEKKEVKVKKEEKKEESKVLENKRYKIIGGLYLLCSILWFVGGFIKDKNNISTYYLDFICAFLLVFLGAYYLMKRSKK